MIRSPPRGAWPPLLDRARRWGDRPAVIDEGARWSYPELALRGAAVGRALVDGLARESDPSPRVAFLIAPGTCYAAALWGIWRAGGVAVPLCVSHPPAELDYVLESSGAAMAIADAEHAPRLQPLCAAREMRLHQINELLVFPPLHEPSDGLPSDDPDGPAMLIYTSGTTRRPKAVVWTHAALQAQLETLGEAWGWQTEDRALGVLPLHHVHGLVNVLLCALWSGAVCELTPGFDARRTWARLASGEISVFMAVPTIYHRLIRFWESAPEEEQLRLSQGAAGLRLMVSGSAALPETTLESWRRITGHVLLERYGMTEIGMALSNPLRGQRVPGAVGRPLPGVEVRLVDEVGCELAAGEPGELEVRGTSVFREYWRRPDESAAAFRDGWFRTGDVATVDEAGVYRILGRSSVDILKTGGFKVSALEIEAVLRRHPAIADCAVVGLADPEWGERVAAAVTLAGPQSIGLEKLRDWARASLAPYKLPTSLTILEALPRNPLGKVIKPELRRRLEEEVARPKSG